MVYKRTRLKGQDMKTGQFAYTDQLVRDGYYPNLWVLPENYDPPLRTGQSIRLPLTPLFNQSPPNEIGLGVINFNTMFNDETYYPVPKPTSYGEVGNIRVTVPEHLAVTGVESVDSLGSIVSQITMAMSGSSSSGGLGDMAKTATFGMTGDSSTGSTGTITPAIQIIQSIQQVEITIPALSSGSTATISSVTTANTILIYNGLRSTDTSMVPRQDLFNIVLTNSTTVTASCSIANPDTDRIVCATVIEFKSGIITSNQSGFISLNAVTTNTATISSVTTSRAAVIWQGNITSSIAQQWDRISAKLNLTNSTTVTATRLTATDTLDVYYTVVEFASGITQSVQEVSTQIGASATTANSTLGTTVTPANCICLLASSSISGATSSDESRLAYSFLASGTTVTATRTGASATVFADVVTNVIEFVPNIIKSRQTAQTTIANAASATATITSVDTTKSAVSWLYQTFDSNSTGLQLAFGTTKLTNSTTVTLNRGASAANPLIQSWEIVEFN